MGYVDWCLSLIEKSGHVMWVATENGKVAGFIAVRLDPSAAEIVLNAVSPNFQRRGIYDSLVKAAGQSLFQDGISNVQVSTQLSNLAPQKVWIKNAMCIDSAVYTFHKWFEA
jgi:ribosomal protein S18 acetylase RimI-like enzyme